MSLQRPQHIETQDPRFFAFRRRTLTLWLVWSLFTVASALIMGSLGLALSLVLLGGLLLETALQIYHRLQIDQVRHYWQTEALFSLFASLNIRHPLPPMRLWAASPDYINHLIALIRQHRPAQILEIGSGVSSIIGGYALREVGGGSLITLEHEEQFAGVTVGNIREHQVDDIVQVIYAPLKDYRIGERAHRWYDLDRIPSTMPGIDLLVVDGPPEGTQEMARFPALPLLFDRLNPGALILVDDFLRDDEYAMVQEWIATYNLRVIKALANEKGVAILQKP